MHENRTCQNLAWSSPSGAGRVISKLVTFANAALTLFTDWAFLAFPGLVGGGGGGGVLPGLHCEGIKASA